MEPLPPEVERSEAETGPAKTTAKPFKISPMAGPSQMKIRIKTDFRSLGGGRTVTADGASSREEILAKIDVDNPNYHEMYVGNLFNEVEIADVRRLLEPFGLVKNVQMYNTHAIVSIECPPESFEKALKTLNHSLWMDNKITVSVNKNTRFGLNKPQPVPTHDKYSHCDRVPRDPDMMSRAPRIKQKVVNTEAISNFLKLQRSSESSSNDNTLEDSNADSPAREAPKEEPKAKQDRRVVTRSFLVFSTAVSTSKRIVEDLTAMFGCHGKVEECFLNPDRQTITVKLCSSERQAMNCLHQTNRIQYKGGPIRVCFPEGTLEDSLEFRKRYVVEYHEYPSPLVPPRYQRSSPHRELRERGSGKTSIPIGSLPSRDSLGAFGAKPNSEQLNSLIQSVRATFGDSVKTSWDQYNTGVGVTNKSYPSPHPKPSTSSEVVSSFGPQPLAPPLTDDPDYLTVDGEIHSVDNKIVLIHFYTGYSFQFAKLVPGQMYVNGKTSLGFIIKNNTFHTWPVSIRKFLHQGAKISMDVRKMSEREIMELRETSSENVMYTTPLVWAGNKPSEALTSISLHKQRHSIVKASVIRLYPKWAILNCELGDILLEVHRMFVNTSLLAPDASLTKHLAIGDMLGVQCCHVEYLEMAEQARTLPYFNGRTDSLKYTARLCWQIVSEVDPHAHRDSKLESGEEDECGFLATSCTLNRQLPNDRDAAHQSWPGIIEEIHLPAGGIILLDVDMGFAENRRRVYFHRSRIFVNGSKIPSSTSLDEELAPGDPVVVDVVLNQSEESGPEIPPYVFSQSAFWVALSVQLNTRDRGSRIAKKLREEVVTRKKKSGSGQRNVINIYSEIEIVITTSCQLLEFSRFSGLFDEFPYLLHFSESRLRR